MLRSPETVSCGTPFSHTLLIVLYDLSTIIPLSRGALGALNGFGSNRIKRIVQDCRVRGNWFLERYDGEAFSLEFHGTDGGRRYRPEWHDVCG